MPNFYGSNEETYVICVDGRIFCLQSPDLEATNGRPVQVQSIPGNCYPVAASSCPELLEAAQALENSTSEE